VFPHVQNAFCQPAIRGSRRHNTGLTHLLAPASARVTTRASFVSSRFCGVTSSHPKLPHCFPAEQHSGQVAPSTSMSRGRLPSSHIDDHRSCMFIMILPKTCPNQQSAARVSDGSSLLCCCLLSLVIRPTRRYRDRVRVPRQRSICCPPLQGGPCFFLSVVFCLRLVDVRG